MLKVFNTTVLTSKQRFLNALLYGTLVSVVLVTLYIFIQRRLPFEIYYIYFGFGYVIGMVIQKTGHGVQVKFSILAAVLCFLAIVIGDLFVFFPGFLTYSDIIPGLLISLLGRYLSLDYGSIFALGFRVTAILVAYYHARVV